MLPPFNADGLLPPGDYDLTFAQIRESHLVIDPDPGDHSNWDGPWRAQLIDNLEILADQLWRVGVNDIFVAGSFVENKDHPNDIDGYFLCDIFRLVSGELQRDLNLLDPHKVWTWDRYSRRPLQGHPKRELPMWHQYRIDLYPHYGQLTGIADTSGRPLCFPDAFRMSRNSRSTRGVVRLRRIA